MKTKKFFIIMTTALTLAFQVNGTTIFSDNFTDAAATNAAWSRSHNQITHSAANGSLSLENSSPFNWGEFLRELGNAQTSEFTISYIQKSATASPRNAGLLFCRTAGSNGYFVTVENGIINISRIVNGLPTPIFTRRSLDLAQSDNAITISKLNSEFHVFVNNVFQGYFMDSQFDSGDIAFLLAPQSEGVFGAITITDTFTQGEHATTFSDNFENGRHKYWIDLSSSGTIVAADGVLRVSQKSSSTAAITYVEFPMTEFDAQVEVRYVDGEQPFGGLYGIVLVGQIIGSNSNEVQMIHFVIDDLGYYAVWQTRDGGSGDITNQSPAINGSTTSASDLIRVVREAGASTYGFFVNGTKLSIDYAVPTDIVITGIGLYAGRGSDVEFDNFTVTRSGDIPTSIRRGAQYSSRHARRVNVNRSQTNTAFYDLRGRKIYNVNTSTNNTRPRNIAAGMYVSEDRKDVTLRRRRR